MCSIHVASPHRLPRSMGRVLNKGSDRPARRLAGPLGVVSFTWANGVTR